MYGYWYSVKEYYSFSKKELTELFWTSLAFAFVLSSYYEKLFVFSASGDVRLVVSGSFVLFLILAVIAVFIAMYCHVALQKLVGIRLGYKVTYSYWLNGILLGLFLSVMTLSQIPILSVFILPGAVNAELVTKLRLGRFRYSTNTKDIARISMAGPIAHVIITSFLGIIFLSTGKNPFFTHIIIANLLLMLYSMLPIPKIDSPNRMDSASDGLGIFFFDRTVYVFCLTVVIFYVALVWAATIFSFITAFAMAFVFLIIYSITVKQPN